MLGMELFNEPRGHSGCDYMTVGHYLNKNCEFDYHIC